MALALLWAAPVAAQFTAGTPATAAAMNAALAAPTITGGSINGAPIGAANPQPGTFTSLGATGAVLFSGTGAVQIGNGTQRKTFSHTSYLSPSSGVLSPLFLVSGNAFGTITSAVSTSVIRAMNVNLDTIDATGAQGGGLAHNYFGGTISSGAKGGRDGLKSYLLHAGPSTAGTAFYVSLAGFADSTGSAGGGVGTKMGNLFGANFSSLLKTGSGLYWAQAVGTEVNVGTQTGTEVLDKVGLQIVQWGTDAAPASRTEAGLVFAAQISGQVTGWKKGITFGVNHGSWPMHPSGSLIALGEQNPSLPARYPLVVANGVDFASVPAKFTGVAFASPGFAVDGTGQVTVGSNTLAWSADGLKLSAVGRRGVVTAVAAGGTAYRATDIVRDDHGGVYEVATVSGGAITALTTIKAPTIAAGAAPSNPRALAGGMGAGATINLTWSDAPYVTVAATQAFRVLDSSGAADLFLVDVGSSFATLTGDLTVTGGATAGSYLVGANQVLGGRRTGWGTVSGTLSRAAFNSGAASTTQVAQTLAALLTDLIAHGLIGP